MAKGKAHSKKTTKDNWTYGRRTAGKEQHAVLTYMDIELYARLKETALKEQRSVAGQVRKCISDWIDWLEESREE